MSSKLDDRDVTEKENATNLRKNEENENESSRNKFLTRGENNEDMLETDIEKINVALESSGKYCDDFGNNSQGENDVEISHSAVRVVSESSELKEKQELKKDRNENLPRGKNDTEPPIDNFIPVPASGNEVISDIQKSINEVQASIVDVKLSTSNMQQDKNLKINSSMSSMPPLQSLTTSMIVRHFLSSTSRFMNEFSSIACSRIEEISHKIDHVEVQLSILEKKLLFVPESDEDCADIHRDINGSIIYKPSNDS